MKIQKINTGIIITKTAKQPSAKIEFSLDELDALSEFCERLQDEKDIREYLNTAVTIPDSAEVSAPVAAKYLRDAALFEQLVDETRRNQEENQSNFLTAVSDAVSSIEKSRDVKEWHGLTKETAERFAREFMAERNPGRWSGFGEVPESVSLDPLNFPINDIYPKGNKPALRMQLISVTYPSLHRVCECSIIEDGVDLWARRTLDSMTAGTVEDLVETVLYVARMYERSKCFERIFVNHIQMEKSVYDALIRHLNDPDSINNEYRISDVVFAADNTIVSVLWERNSKDGVSGMVTLTLKPLIFSMITTLISMSLETFERRTNMFTKELYKITCTRNGETSDIGTYLLKPGPEAPMDCYRNFLNKTDVAVSIKSVPEGFIITDNSEPDTSYHLMLIPMDDDFWARCAAEKETKQ